jgi:hypothetical protein
MRLIDATRMMDRAAARNLPATCDTARLDPAVAKPPPEFHPQITFDAMSATPVFADAPLIVPIHNPWCPVPITV